jgi:ribonuclease P protein component
MLSKINRLTKESEFQEVFKNGRSVSGEFVWLKYKKNNMNSARAGFVVGLKVSKKATERNKIKRRLRSAFRYFLKEASGYDIIVGVKPEIKEKKFSEIVRVLKNLLIKIK